MLSIVTPTPIVADSRQCYRLGILRMVPTPDPASDQAWPDEGGRGKPNKTRPQRKCPANQGGHVLQAAKVILGEYRMLPVGQAGGT